MRAVAGPDSSRAAADVQLDGPVDLPRSLDFFRRSGDDLIDRFDGRRFVRVLTADGRTGAVVMTPAGDVEHPRLHVRCGFPSGRPDYLPNGIRSAVRGQFVPPTGHSRTCAPATAGWRSWRAAGGESPWSPRQTCSPPWCARSARSS